MPILQQEANHSLFFSKYELVKIRELSSDSVLFAINDIENNAFGHTAELPLTCTVTSTLPVPRKGNPGTVKTLWNFRMTDTLDKGTASERKVPVIVKLETSFPIGSDSGLRNNAIPQLIEILASLDSDEWEKYTYSGILPE